MNSIKLTYFDMNGGRGEVARIAMSIGGIDFEDNRISFSEFGQQRSKFPLGAVPVMEINGDTYCQSDAINRYFGKLAGLYPIDAWEAFKCDEIMGATEDVTHAVVRTFGLEGEALVAARKTLTDGMLTTFLKFLSNRLEAAGGRYFASKQLTVADIRAFVQLRSFNAGVLDHVPTDLTERVAPKLTEYHDKIAKEPGVVAYYDKIK